MEKQFELENSVHIPSVGFGTWQTPDGVTAVDAVRCAIETGYRHIDTAAVYGNEKSVGEGIARSGIDRRELFVTSKVWNTERGYDTTLRAFDRTLADLGLEYLDLYLIHWPATAHRFEDWQRIGAFIALWIVLGLKNLGKVNAAYQCRYMAGNGETIP
jgi:diketogulonate reductase-like aldo/keto reductase